MSDYNKARALVTRLSPKGYDGLETLDELLGKNQNPPPDGDADGSFSIEQWEALRIIITSLTNMQGAMEHFSKQT